MSFANLSTKRQRIAALARDKRGVALSTLHHVIDLEWMKEAWRLTRKDGAPGIDGMTAVEYAKNLEANLLDLLGRIKSGRYQAPPVRRAYIPKADGSPRPLGLPTLEDKVAQRAIVMVLEAVYEQDFLSCSHGFRPGRSAHQALQDLRTGFMSHGLRWVLDIDIVKYFDSIPHSHLRAFLDRRVTDGVIRRMIDKWLKAGVLEDGLLRHATEGSPQGGVISPILSNIFLHHVLDEWFESEVRPRLAGNSALVRFADDAVMAFAYFRDASPERFGQAASSVWANAASREDAVRRFSLQQLGWVSPGNGGDLVHLSRLLPRLGQDQEGWQSGAASDGEEPLRPRPGGGHRLVPDQPASADQGSARPSERDDARPLRLLRRLWQLSTTELVRQRGREHLEEMAIATRSPQTIPLEPLQ